MKNQNTIGFKRNTKLLTPNGILSFDILNNGDKINIYDKNGVIREGVVRSYSCEATQIVILSRHKPGKHFAELYRLQCAIGQQWMLQDGSIVSLLNHGDTLYQLPGDPSPWVVIDVNINNFPCEVWSVEESETHTFVLRSGVVATGI